MTDSHESQAHNPVDLDAVQQLIQKMEDDLARVRSGAGDVERLREEVDALKALLSDPQPSHRHVGDALHSLHTGLKRDWSSAAETKAFVASRYAAEIGRILGLQ